MFGEPRDVHLRNCGWVINYRLGDECLAGMKVAKGVLYLSNQVGVFRARMTRCRAFWGHLGLLMKKISTKLTLW